MSLLVEGGRVEGGGEDGRQLANGTLFLAVGAKLACEYGAALSLNRVDVTIPPWSRAPFDIGNSSRSILKGATVCGTRPGGASLGLACGVRRRRPRRWECSVPTLGGTVGKLGQRLGTKPLMAWLGRRWNPIQGCAHIGTRLPPRRTCLVSSVTWRGAPDWGGGGAGTAGAC